MNNKKEMLRAKLEIERHRSEALDRMLKMPYVIVEKFDSKRGMVIQQWLADNVDIKAYRFLTKDANYTGSKMEWTAYFGFENVGDAVHFKLAMGEGK
ncbi:hypothetical protein [Escherichia coli]|uniref:hypothetical protein n=1 Tax=Escherichia coli TaxID=562 RepID=UPI000E2152A8|nr:hypothetical protein [Escherichia coli]